MKTSTRTIILILSLPLLIILPLFLNGQNLPQVSAEKTDRIAKETNSPFLKQWAKHDSVRYYQERARAEDFALNYGYPIKGKTADGRTFELQGFDEAGQLKYYATMNRGGAATISTDEVWPGGNAGTSLTGQGWTLAVWDGGRVRTTHAELSSKVTHVDNASTFSDHATHVTGTCIARGANSDARGMAYNAQARTFDWNNDFSEMASEAADGLRVSNHSYGPLSGWEYDSEFDVWEWYGYTPYSQSEDYQFGYYDQDSYDLDQIVQNAPFYLPVAAAGNDRDDYFNGTHFVRNASGIWVQSNTSRPPDGGNDGFDCISGFGNAKNVLTVGAVVELPNGYGSFTDPNDVEITDFSSWGPTDDGRIKPDLVAKGIDVISCTAAHNNDYSNFQGTSMAAPMVTGSILLINEHVNNLFPGSALRASAMKALLIHTADECGSALGPDYRFGWGLMNTQKAVELLSDDSGRQWFRSRDSISNGDTRSYTFGHDGIGGIKVTIAWTDVPGNVCAPPTSSWWVCGNRMLVNDLDLRLINLNTDTEYSPWRLNPDSPGSSATRGDNDRDNVEQVHVPNLPAGEYAIVIDHKGTLFGGEQIFSIMLSGIGAVPDVFTCNEATIIQCGDVINATTSGGSQNVAVCGNTSDLDGAPGKWYRFVGEGSTITMSTCTSGTNFDTQIAVFTGSCNNLICENGNDDIDECAANMYSSYVQFFAEAGQTYFIYLTGYGNESGSFTLQVDCEGIACPVPEGLLTTDIGHTHFTVDWNTANGPDLYQLRTRQLPSGDWQLSNEYEDPGVIFGNRVPDSDYEAQVRSKCGNTYSDWSPSIFLTTLGAGNPYCFSYGISWNYWIDRFVIKDMGSDLLNWETGTDYGYSDYSSIAPIPEVTKGNTYEFCITPDKRSSLPNEALRYHLYLDWTNDQTFGSGDQSYTWCCTSELDEFCENILIPTNIPDGEYRIRISMVVDDSDNGVNACSIGGQREVEDYTIRVIDNIQAPVANFSTSVTCGEAPLTISFTDNSTNNPNTWQWDFGNGQVSNQQNPTITYNEPGIYTVSLNAENAGGSDSEVKTAYITVVTPMVISTPAGTSACLGETLTLTAIPGSDTYLWSGPGLQNTTGQIVQVTPSQSGTFTYDLIATTNGCVADPVSVNLNFLNTPEVHLTASTTTACLGESVTLSATGAQQYNWAGPGLNTTNGAVVMATPTQVGTYTYQVIGLTSDCGSEPATITITFEDTPEIEVVASSLLACQGEAVTLTATGASDYTWDGTGLNAMTGAVVTVNPNQAGTYIYEVTGLTGDCSSEPATITITFEDTPHVEITASSLLACQGEAVTLTATGATDYTWDGTGLNASTGAVVTVNPNQAGTYIYEVTGLTGDCSSEPATVTITFEDTPHVEITASSLTACQGEAVTLTATGASNFSWTGAGLSASTGAVVTVNPNQAGTYIYEVTGLTGDCSSEPATVTITFEDTPHVEVTASSLLACQGEAVTLTATGASNFSWTGAGLSATTGAVVTVNPGQAGTYTYEVTGLTSDCSSEPVTISIEFTEALEIQVSANHNSVCLGESITLTATGASNYSWTGPGINNQSGHTIHVSQNQAGTFTYQVLGTSGTCGSATASISIQFEAPPLVSLSTSSTTSCVGQSITLTGLGAESYAWTGIGLNNNAGMVVEAMPEQAGNYTYQVVGFNGECSSTPQTITLQFNSLPEVEISANSTSLCEGQGLSLTANGANTYIWDGPGIAGNTGANISLIPEAGNITFQVIGSTNGCDSEPASVEVDITPTPTLMAEASNDPACLGDTLILQASGANQYFWNGPDLLSFSGSIVQVVPSQTGEFSYQLTGSVGTCQAEPINIPITVAHAPLSVIVEMEDCGGESMLFQAEVANGGEQPNILWYLNGLAVWSGASYQLFGAENGDEVFCEVTAVNPPACTSPLMVQSDIILVDCLTSTRDIPGLVDLQIYPNPNSGQFVLKLNLISSFSGKISILNNLGQQVMEQEMDIQVGTQVLPFDLPEASVGLYHLVMNAEEGLRTLKFVIN